MTFVSKSERDTERLGAALSRVLKKGSFVTLRGDLGAGKTALSRGLTQALGSDECASPTFTIVREYRTDPPVYHFDAYRLSGADELYEIGCEEYFSAGGIVLMEWPEIAESLLPKEKVEITFEKTGNDGRRITVTGLTANAYKVVQEEYGIEDTCD